MSGKKKEKAAEEERAVREKIREYEARGGEWFFCDVENDPPSRTLTPKDVDYLHETAKYRFHGFFARIVERLFAAKYRRELQIAIEGGENLRELTGGAVFTSNHFSPYENIAVLTASRKAPGKHRMYKLVREGNYFMPGLVGWLLKYCDTLPLSSSPETLRLLNKAIMKILGRGDFLLIYPEQAMWRGYKKPRPYRVGAFYYAAKSGVPVVPCFVTQHQKDASKPLADGNTRYTIHVGAPIRPDPARTVRQNAERMMEENAAFTKKIYEEAYGVPLCYDTVGCGENP